METSPESCHCCRPAGCEVPAAWPSGLNRRLNRPPVNGIPWLGTTSMCSLGRHRAQGTRHRAPGFRHRAQGTGHKAQGTGHQASGTRHRAQASGQPSRGATGVTVCTSLVPSCPGQTVLLLSHKTKFMVKETENVMLNPHQIVRKLCAKLSSSS